MKILRLLQFYWIMAAMWVKSRTAAAFIRHEGRGLFINGSYQGSTHDKSIWDQIDLDFGDLHLLIDLGF
jgi:hypothetical protein